MVTLQLSAADAAFLSQQIRAQVEHLENELVHTDDRSMQRELAGDFERLKALCERITRAADAEQSTATF